MHKQASASFGLLDAPLYVPDFAAADPKIRDVAESLTCYGKDIFPEANLNQIADLDSKITC